MQGTFSRVCAEVLPRIGPVKSPSVLVQRHEPPGVDFSGRGQHECSTNLSSTDGRDSRETRIDVPRCCTGCLGGLVDSEKVHAAEQVFNSKADFAMALSA
jgi:hypothetical protein